MFFWKLGIKIFFKLVASLVNDIERINIKKERNQHSSVFKALNLPVPIPDEEENLS